ncbi:hypothetical protein ABZ671_01005 [Micromonospora sp. NPDC006766]
MSVTSRPTLRQRIAGVGWEFVLVSAILTGAITGTIARELAR